MSETKTLVLNHKQIQKKITRIAFEIYERNASEEDVVFAGISGMGYVFAQLLANKVREISPLQVEEVEVKIEKFTSVQPAVELTKDINFEGKCLIVVDDVLNSGRTLAYAMKPFLEVNIKKMEVAVLVNRSHKLFPVNPDYTGYELSTTLSEHIIVSLEENNSAVYLH
ncbi:phosphoribosyltransferase family protein [Echinicola jeungdonensis]|uniref:Phosphoribosyltransferase family protein n=1 Tax=Echinicola jeungdonensis TaxID=709343 RepID=A0ABV5J3F6_9BACT|nr:phosphoribosyltransferase family protein [Echinicola jeungdonensis]MDN3669614.1 phosphoribosyltransferase family protein [Echinicola jeungdonensis]